MTDFTFLIGKYTDEGLEKELAGLLAAAQAKSPAKGAKRKGSSLALPVLMLLVGVYLVVAGVRDAKVVFWAAGALAIIGGAYYAWMSRDAAAQRPVAKRLLRSLNGIEASSKAAVLFSESGMTIRAKNNEANVSYGDVSVAGESVRLYVLLHQGAATVLQKRDLVGKEPEAFTAYLMQKTDGRYIRQAK